MTTERKQELVGAAVGASTNIEIAELFRQSMHDSGDEAGVANINQDINCLQRWKGLDLELADAEPDG